MKRLAADRGAGGRWLDVNRKRRCHEIVPPDVSPGPAAAARSFEFVAGFLAGQKGGNLPKSETHLHKSETE